MRSRRAIRILTVTSIALAAPPLFALAAGKRTYDQVQQAYDAHKGEFDYLLGDWTASRGPRTAPPTTAGRG